MKARANIRSAVPFTDDQWKEIEGKSLCNNKNTLDRAIDTLSDDEVEKAFRKINELNPSLMAITQYSTHTYVGHRRNDMVLSYAEKESNQLETSEIGIDDTMFYTSDRREFIEARLERTYKRLLEKGICTELLSDALANVTRYDLNFGFWVLDYIICRVHNYEPDELKLDKETWYLAIEQVVAKYNRQALLDDTVKNFTNYIKCHEAELNANAVFIYFGGDEWHHIMENRENTKNDRTELLDNLKSAERKIEKLKDNLASREAEYNSLQNALNAQKEREANLREEHRQTIESIENEYRAEIEKLTKSLEDFKDKAELLEKILFISSVNVPPCETGEEIENIEIFGDSEESEYIELPESNVLFLGGHSNLLGKVKAVHPDWVLLNDSDYKHNILKQNIEVIFYWSNHISHKLQKMVYSEMGRNIPIVYVTATNIDLLEREMKNGYYQIVGNKEKTEIPA